MKRSIAAGVLVACGVVAQMPAGAAVTFNKDVLPILQKNCQSCHRPGEIAPMSLLTYKDARPWAKSIKTAVAGRKMPPWFADPKYSHFSNERRLTDGEIATLATWADTGAAEGNAKDMPAPVKFPDGWTIQPDVVVEMAQPHEVPVTGLNENLYFVAKGAFTEDVWVEAAEVRPSNRSLVHHMRVWIRPPGSNWLAGTEYGPSYPLDYRAPQGTRPAAPGAVQEILAKYNPGIEPQEFTMNGAAKLIPKGSDIVFEAHYTTVGKVASDRSRIGLKLSKVQPKQRFVTITTLGSQKIDIAPGDPNAEQRNEGQIDQDVTVAWLQPHMHMRGKDYTLTAHYPSGETQIILKTGYDFNWQMGYTFEKPIVLPKGTKLVGVGHYDNSANNKYNPDPKVRVHWGVQSTDEMSLLYMGVLVDHKTDPQKVFSRLVTNSISD